MELKDSSLKSLLDSAEAYIKTSIELFKLKTIDAATEKAAVVLGRAIVVFLFFMFVLMISIALGLWLGSLLGGAFYGFLIVAGAYLMAGILMYFFAHKWLRKIIGNAIISLVFKEE